jgi:hypothetical protein
LDGVHLWPAKYGSDAPHLFMTVYRGTSHWHQPATKTMPGFAGRLSTRKILQVLSFIKHEYIDTLGGSPESLPRVWVDN